MPAELLFCNGCSWESEEAAIGVYSIKTSLLKTFAKFIGKHVSINKTIKKQIQTQLFSCEFCEIFKNIFFTEHLRVIAFATEIFKPNKTLVMIFINDMCSI